MKEIQTASHVKTSREESKIEYFQVAEGHYAVRVTGVGKTSYETVEGQRDHEGDLPSFEGVVDSAGLEVIFRDKRFVMPASGVRLISDGTLQDIYRFGVDVTAHRLGHGYRDRDALHNPDKSDLFEDLRSGRRTAEHLVRIYNSVAYGWDRYPIAQGFELHAAPGYGNFSDDHYDMEAAKAHLVQRADILVINRDTYEPWGPDDEGRAGLIWQAPVDFLREVHDDHEDHRVLFKGKMWQMAFKQDFFGLRAAGIARHESYNPTW